MQELEPAVSPRRDDFVYTCTDSPLGEILLAFQGRSLISLSFQEGTHPLTPRSNWVYRPDLRHPVVAQIESYFRGGLTRFDVPLAVEGTPFQRKVWRTLREIPFATVLTYRELAVRIGNPPAVRAVGAANGRNPLPLVIPCHRVIGSDGTLTGFRGGIRLKRLLLEHEARVSRHSAACA